MGCEIKSLAARSSDMAQALGHITQLPQRIESFLTAAKKSRNLNFSYRLDCRLDFRRRSSGYSPPKISLACFDKKRLQQ